MEVISYLLGKKAGGGSSPVLQEKNITITENGTETIVADAGYDGLSSVNIDTNVPSSGGVIKENDVNFYDYDGTLTNSYTKNEFLALSQMPENPTHQGLISQGWNWILSDAQNYVNDYGMLNIGQMYDTNDGSVRIHIKVQDGRLSPYLGFAVDGTAIINWGDGSSTDTVTGASTSTYIFTLHNYEQAGEYVISITSESDIYIGGSSTGTYLLTANGSTSDDNRNYAYRNSITRIDGIKNLKENALYACFLLSSITIPNDAINFVGGAFRNCVSLQSVIIPNSMSQINRNLFNGCSSLLNVILPNTINRIEEDAFTSCTRLSTIIIPNSVNYIANGVFGGCKKLSNVACSNNIPSLATTTFKDCSTLSKITFNKASYIYSSCFQNCYSLSNIAIPSNTTNIESTVFYNCYSLAYVDFSNHTSVPALSNSNAFLNTPSDCKIIVPDDLYESWIGATNWSTYASKIIKESEWNA